MSEVLVAGGAGYVGSHVVAALVAAGRRPVVLDDFSNSRCETIGRLERLTGASIPVVQGSIADAAAVDAALARREIGAAILLAGLKSAPDSVSAPLTYHRANVGGALALAERLDAAGVRRIVFSSSATVYAPGAESPIDESALCDPATPYGASKRAVERLFEDMAAARRGWRVANLRYFNPAGAHPSGLIGEDPKGTPGNLFPLLAATAAGERPLIEVFGRDYDTPDGSGVRDYIHVCDLAEAHLSALDLLEGGEGDAAWTLNLGSGGGHSVLEVIAAWERAIGRSLPREERPRRPGDLGRVIADPARAAAVMGWRPTRDLDEMCRSHWRWRSGAGSAAPGGAPRARAMAEPVR